LFRSTAGALELKTLDKIAGPTLWLSGATPLGGPRAVDNYDRRIVGIASPIDGSVVAAQIGDSDGPFVHPSGFAQANALGKWQGRSEEHTSELQSPYDL